MKHDLALGCALLGLIGAATVAGAYPLGGGSTVRPSAGIHNSLSSSLGDTRLDHWKKPFDSDDGGGPSDPTRKKKPSTKGKLGCKQHTGPCP